MVSITIIIQDTPYGIEKTYNALRLALALTSGEIKAKVNIFLLGDAVYSAVKGHNPPEGYYNIEKMLKELIARGCRIKVCGSCIRLRGVKEDELIEGIETGTMIELAKWVIESDKVIVF